MLSLPGHVQHCLRRLQAACLACVAALNRDTPGALPGQLQLESDVLVCVLAHQAAALQHLRQHQPLLPSAPAADHVHAAIIDCLATIGRSAPVRRCSMTQQLIGLLQAACAAAPAQHDMSSVSAALAQVLCHHGVAGSAAQLAEDAALDARLISKVQAVLHVRMWYCHLA